MIQLKHDDEIGNYLKSKITKKYNSIRKFCQDYIRLRDNVKEPDEVDNEETRKLLNRFSQILNGKKRIQIDDLPYVSDLLDMSYEEILTAGQTYQPIKGHMTNYEIAFSKDPDVWDKYMNHPEKLFLNPDEYNKTVIDYALEFKNYEFMKFLLDKEFIYFVDTTDERKMHFFSYGAGTKIQRRKIGYIDNLLELELQTQDALRTDTIALAIENNDVKVLDKLKALEIPDFTQVRNCVNISIDFRKNRNKKLIDAIARSENKKINDYFSKEFKVKSPQGIAYTYIFPFLDEVILKKIKLKQFDTAKQFLDLGLSHNQTVFEQLNDLIDKAFNHQMESRTFDYSGKEEDCRKSALWFFEFNEKSHLVSYDYMIAKHKHINIASNILKIDIPQRLTVPDELNDLIKKINNSYKKIVAIGREDK